MVSEDIKNLKESLEKAEKRVKENDDELLANLSTQPGWEVFKERIARKINTLLEPGIEDMISLEQVGAITLARELGIYCYRSALSEVEASVKAKQAQGISE